jgi:hypothetical protein
MSKAAAKVTGESARDRTSTRFEAVMEAAKESGLLGAKSARIGGRVSPALIEQAKRQTGIAADTDLLEFAPALDLSMATQMSSKRSKALSIRL